MDEGRGRGMGRGRQHYLSPQHSTSSINTASGSSYAHGHDDYLAPDPSSIVQEVQWVYEWENPEFYNMLVSQWQTTAAWTGQTWEEYKAALLATRGIALMSTIEHHMAHYSWMTNDL